MEQFRSGAVTHQGAVRDHNEDIFVNRADIGLWAVADGASGHHAGDVASQVIANALQSISSVLDVGEMISQVRLRMTDTHTALQELASQKGKGRIVASTVVVLVIRQGHYAFLWAGDSRGYLLRDGVLQRVTRDHSFVQEMVDAGNLDEREAEHHPQANVITRAVGANGDACELDKVAGALVSGDRFLLCSDGLSRALDETGIAAILRACDPDEAAKMLVEAALAKRAADNVTAVVVEVRTDGKM